MKKLITVMSTLAILTANAVELMWDRNPEPEVSGYKVYIGGASRSYHTVIDVGNTLSHNLDRFKGSSSNYYFAVTAYVTYDGTNTLESPFSEEVTAAFLKAPGNVKIRK